MDIYRITCKNGGQYTITLWGVTPADVEALVETLEKDFSACAVLGPVPDDLWTQEDKERLELIEHSGEHPLRSPVKSFG